MRTIVKRIEDNIALGHLQTGKLYNQVRLDLTSRTVTLDDGTKAELSNTKLHALCESMLRDHARAAVKGMSFTGIRNSTSFNSNGCVSRKSLGYQEIILVADGVLKAIEDCKARVKAGKTENKHAVSLIVRAAQNTPTFGGFPLGTPLDHPARKAALEFIGQYELKIEAERIAALAMVAAQSERATGLPPVTGNAMDLLNPAPATTAPAPVKTAPKGKAKGKGKVSAPVTNPSSYVPPVDVSALASAVNNSVIA